MSETQNNDIQARLQRMIEEDPYSKEAETLLNYLAAYGSKFMFSEVGLMAPMEMPQYICDLAFKSLKKWEFIEPPLSTRSWKIQDAIFPHLQPPAPYDGANVRARLQRMVEEDPYGTEAEALLQGLAAFGQKFHVLEVPFGAPINMSQEVRDLAFRSLKEWRFISEITYFGGWQIANVIFPFIASPDPDPIKRRRYEHYESLYAHSQLDETSLYDQIKLDWPGIISSFNWGLAHLPESSLDFVWHMHPSMMYRQHWFSAANEWILILIKA